MPNAVSGLATVMVASTMGNRSSCGAMLVLGLVPMLVLACDRPAEERSAPATVQSVPATALPTAVPTPEAPRAPEPPSFADRFLGDPAPDTRRSETVFGAGVYVGLPPAWATQDVYNAYLIAETKQARTMVHLVSGKRSGDAALDRVMNSAAHSVFLSRIEWDTPWLDAKIGPSGYVARVRRGHGSSVLQRSARRAAFALYVPVPERTPISILGSWNEPDPEIEQQFIDLVRGIGRCRHKPKRGCVPVAPLGEEKELESPPKAAPGSSPFG
jgi:hypothetical protein